jgi:CRP/FNR family transcriptional regulator
MSSPNTHAAAPALKVFLVDDSVLICRRLEVLLRAIPGVQVIGTAATPDDALRGIEHGAPEVAIIDMQLKGGNGLSVLKELASRALPVTSIMLTNNANAQLREQCERAGARFFFDKSTDFNRVRDAIKALAANPSAARQELAMLPQEQSHSSSHDHAAGAAHNAPEAAAHGELRPLAAVQCSNCATRTICLPSGLSDAELASIDAMIGISRKVRRGEALYRAGDAFENIYTIKAGSFKTVVVLRDGREQITGFQLVGEPLGMDGISTEHHLCDAVALEDSILCVIPFHKLEALCYELKPMQRHVHRWMCSEIARESGQMTLLGSMSAEERVATFLLNISQRLQARGYSGSEFNLRMTREDIGSYLGLKLETVSRMLSRFQKELRIDVQGRLIRILDREGLQQI